MFLFITTSLGHSHSGYCQYEYEKWEYFETTIFGRIYQLSYRRRDVTVYEDICVSSIVPKEATIITLLCGQKL